MRPYLHRDERGDLRILVPFHPQLVDNLASLPREAREHDPAQLSWLVRAPHARIAEAFVLRAFPGVEIEGGRP